ncbi:MAG: DUF4855 domain-containing protein [Armatimonadota bacterium]
MQNKDRVTPFASTCAQSLIPRGALVLLCIGALVISGAARAEYPTPEEAGFHHCALIYNSDERGPDEMALYVANGEGWLFDAFLFLHQRTHTGRSTMNGKTDRADWEGQLDTWFAPERDLHALDAAIEAAQQQHGPVAPRQVIFSIPYPNRQVTDFGDVDGDGVTESLAVEEGRSAVARWYIAEAERRFEAAGFRHLQLWGFYWMAENASTADIEVARQFSDTAHAAGKRMLWIPWFMAPNWDRWRDMGIDVAIMQPNYAFLSTHHGKIRRNRLILNARAARREGLGVEIELPMAWNQPGADRLFRHYLRDGAADREGYQQAATAYYLGSNAVEQTARSDEPQARVIYDDLCAYVQNETVAEPDTPVQWEVGGEKALWLSDRLQDEGHPVHVARAAVRAEPCGTLDVMLYEPETYWTGEVTVEGQSAPGADWQPVGWAMRAQKNERDGAFQVLTVPLGGTWESLRVCFDGDGVPCVSELALYPPLFDRSTHLAQGAPYTFSHTYEARYPDSGNELTDGRIPETGFPSGETVGWQGSQVSITFDLQTPTPVTHAEVHVQGGSYAAVHWPRSAMLTASNTKPSRRTSGLGAPPADVEWVAAEPVVIDRRRSTHDLDGHLTFRPQEPLDARYVTFILEPLGHLMVSEIRIFNGDENIAAGREYSVLPSPTPRQAAQTYPDDGHKLTDGHITGFARRDVVGWRDDEERTAVVDLQHVCRVDEVLVWTMTGSRYAIYPLAEASVALSEDGQNWSEIGSAAPQEVPDDPSTPCAAIIDTGGQSARYVRVTVRRSRNWGMLSEIEVRGEIY